MSRISTAADFAATFDVSRETMARLELYHAMLARWNRRINLVSRASMADAWHRHFADSAQLWPLCPRHARRWLDLGSGGGFPGLVVAVLAAESRPRLQVALIESDQRKASFLQEAAARCGVEVVVHAERVESLPPQGADVVSARALAPLPTLLGYAEKHRRADGIALFAKGETVHKEIASAAAHWRFDHRIHPSRTDPHAAIVEIGALERA